MAEEKNKNNKSANSKDEEQQKKQQQENDRKGKETITIFEYAAAVLGAIFVFGSVVYMTYKAVTAEDIPPELTVQVKSVVKNQSGYLVRFEIKNDGEYTAAGAIIKGELKNGETVEETSTTTVDYVPSYSTRSGGVIFGKNPQDYNIDLRATGYTEP